MSGKTIGETTLAEAHASNVKSAQDAVDQGIWTEDVRDFSNAISDMLRAELEKRGMTAADMTLMLPALAEFTLKYQGLLDTRSPNKRRGPVGLAFMVEAVANIGAMAKRHGKEIPAHLRNTPLGVMAGLSDESQESTERLTPPNLYN